jgi:hypothetical protein
MQIGISVDVLSGSQLSYELVRGLNNISSDEHNIDVCLFYNRLDILPYVPAFAMFQDRELWGFKAPVIATSLTTAKTLLDCPCPTKKYFYIWNFEWTNKVYDAARLAEIYMHKDIELIARSESHANTIEKLWKKPKHIIKAWNDEQIKNIF